MAVGTIDHTRAWEKADAIKKGLIADGWVTQDTYSKEFAPLIDGPAVYLFLLHEREEYRKAIVAYVGMSDRLRRRIATHNILPLLQKPGYWPMTWFRPVPRKLLRETEREYIRRFDPPWNIVGRVRGFVLQ